MPTVSEALFNFLNARKTPANQDLVERWSAAMETQVNVAPGKGEPVAGKRSTWSDGSMEWHNIRCPKNAATDPTFTDYELRFPLDWHAEGIGCTGWDWQERKSLWFGFDFDSLVGHAKGIGIDDVQLAKVKEAACALPYVQVRRSTGGGGIHLYVYVDGIPTQNHTEHAALARCILGMMSAETGFDFASQVDAAGAIMWVWHRKMTADNHGLEIIKPHTQVLTEANLPANWKDHIEVVRRQRTKVRVNQIASEDQDPFEALTASRKIVPLDDSHKAQIENLMRSGFTSLWIQDHHLLQTHTCALLKIKEEMHLEGVFQTNSEAKDPGSPNCFLFPLPNGAWRVYRFSPGVHETETWTQDGNGWTTCAFNRKSSLAGLARVYRGTEDPEKGGFSFTSADAIEVAKLLGQKIEVDTNLKDRKVTLKAHKDGRLVADIIRVTGDTPLEGWVEKKTKFTKVFEIKADPNDDNERLDFEYDKIIRSLITPAKEHAGWVTKHEGQWVHQPAGEVKKMLQSLGHAKDESDNIMGEANWNSWWLVNLPFREEHPNGRQWNLEAAQFAFKPAELRDDEAPHHPHWDMIFNHIGSELTPALQELPWAVKAGIKRGADYLRAWVACAFRDPFEPTPYLFLFGSEDCGKSILYESLQLLLTKGVALAKRALTSEFNAELAGAIICAVEEIDLTKSPGAHAKIKEYCTGVTLSIRQMRHDSYEQPNMTHWIQTANKRTNCPIFEGDTRVTMIYVPDLLKEQIIPRHKLKIKLREEAPHFLHTLMHLELPPYLDRLRIPIVATASKRRVEEENRTSLQRFINEHCILGSSERVLLSDLVDRFCNQVPTEEKYLWSNARVQKELPSQMQRMVGAGDTLYYTGLSLKPETKPGEKHG